MSYFGDLPLNLRNPDMSNIASNIVLCAAVITFTVQVKQSRQQKDAVQIRDKCYDFIGVFSMFCVIFGGTPSNTWHKQLEKIRKYLIFPEIFKLKR